VLTAQSRLPSRISRTLAFVYLACWFVGSTAAVQADEAPPAMTQVQTIPLDGVEGRFDHFGVDAARHRLYVAALGNNSLEVIDLAAGRRVMSVAGLKKPTGVRVLPDSGNVVVASGDDGKVRVYDPDLKLLGTLGGLDDADNVRLDPSDKLAYVGYGEGALAVIDPAGPNKLASIKLEAHPEAFQVEDKGSRIFVNVPGARHVAVIDREKRSVVARWRLRDAAENFPMALDEAHQRLFVGCRKPAKVLVLDTHTGKAVAALDYCGDTDDLSYDTNAGRLYVTGGAGCITVIEQADADHYRTLGNLPTAEGARTSAFVPQTRTLYVAVPHRGNQPAELRAYRATKRR
jgi:DNA-binding beta-propeller fold protein YncE